MNSRKYILISLIIIFSFGTIQSCAPKMGGHTVTVVKPKKRLFFKGYRDKKGKMKKRVKTVKYKTIH
jgi:hypothetical protein